MSIVGSFCFLFAKEMHILSFFILNFFAISVSKRLKFFNFKFFERIGLYLTFLTQRTLNVRESIALSDDLLFILFGFSWFTYVSLALALLVWLNPNQSNRRSDVH